MILVQVLLVAVGVYIFLNTFYSWFFVVAGKLLPPIKTPHNEELNRFAIYVPCYKGDEVILSSAAQNLQVDYPQSHYKLIVIADHLQAETVAALRQMPLQVVEVQFENSTKAKSLIAAAEQTEGEYDYALILDIDNIMKKDFLRILNHHLAAKPTVVQGHRVALNTDTSMALLDALSEEIGNFIFRLGHAKVGLSAAFIGSAKAIEYQFYRQFIPSISAVGEDKEMEMKLLRAGHRIRYAPDALVYDEKVQALDRFQKQRTRWLAAQFYFLKEHLGSGIRDLLLRGNLDYFDKVIQMALFPRLLLLGLSTLMAFVALWLPLYPASYFWWGNALLLYLAFFLALPAWAYRPATLRAVLTLPKTFLVMFATLFKLKGANKKFIHTEHSATAHHKKTDT